MSDRQLHSDFDDELLSAYLDDELSADERAAVEVRLADDPDARQLLEQLRAVSQSVQGLPEESLGRDLRASVMQQAEASKRTARTLADPPATTRGNTSNGAPSLLDGDPIPRISIGRSRRSWIWASLAVAAALLIMFQQSGDENKGNLPAVAQRNGEVSGKVAEASAADRASLDDSLTVAPGAATPALSAPPAATVTSDETRHDVVPPGDSSSRASTFSDGTGGPREAAETSDKLVTNSPFSPTNESGPRGEGLAGGGSLTAKVPEGQVAGAAVGGERARRFGGGGAPEERALESESVPQSDQAQDVVVRVVAKRTALDNKMIDQLLAKNGIAIDAEQLTDDKSEASDRGLAERARLAPAREESAVPLAETKQDECDVVVVDAPHKAIASCVSDLNRDSTNFACVEVDDAAGALGTNKDKQPLQANTFNKQVSSDLRQFNRGTVPEQQKQFFARNQEYYFQQKADDDLARNGAALNYGVERGRAELELKIQTELLDRAGQNVANQGRAFRVSNSNLQNRFSEEQLKRSAAIVSGAYKEPAIAPAAKVADNLADENMRVWFFICPEEATATSTPGKSGAK